ncbi:pyridoxal phosphate-dependent aminotransferase [uncultured Desulfobacter sp.]|uniref:pyridoxal phosphate-dependent aminotransferase n=1 Tax=uncultured Desulfobacter sp. TaxID=240139 RepID=UPI0029F524F6|nr:pyridoxal phosphate-dependent aminotransferase [uncultured Desulfobacter sp.]
MYISKNIESLRYSVIREMSQVAAQYEDVISLGIGEPDFDTPAPIIEKAFEDARKGHTHYTHAKGHPELIEKLSCCLSKDLGKSVPPECIIVTHGAMNGLANAFRTLMDPGDEIIVVEPHFPDYLAHITLAHAVPKFVPSGFDKGFLPDPADIEAAITSKTKIILINSPNNPTGTVVPKSLLEEIAAIAQAHDICVVSDEVYDRICFEGRAASIYNCPGMENHSLVINSFSKTYAMTGWRVGFAYGPQPVIDQMVKVGNYAIACASSVSQRAALAALDTPDEVIKQMSDTFERRMDLVCSRLEAMPGVRVNRPKGSFYVFADISSITNQSRQFALDLIKEEKVVVVPGYPFGLSCEGCIRIACTIGREKLSEAMDRLARFLAVRRH